MSRTDRRATERAQRSRRAAREQRYGQRYGRFLRFTFLGSLIPGVGLIAAGRKVIGGLCLTLFLLGLAAVAAAFIVVPTNKLASYGGDRQLLMYAGIALVAGAATWLIIALSSHHALEPRGLSGGKRLFGALVLIVSASVVVAPMAIAANMAFTQRDVWGAIAGDDEPSQTTPKNLPKKDPWANKARLNLLLLGADVGKGRGLDQGIRPDTQIVASIDTKSGDTTLISLPRNMTGFPFPEESGLQEYYPDGYIADGDPESPNSMLNSVWNNIPANYPDLKISSSDANKWAVEGALGIDIDYYMMVNLDGFETIIDALGGVTINVSEPVPIHYGEPDMYCASRYTTRHIEEGPQELTGARALMYARSRCGSTNYERMERQQCVMRAIIDEARPATLLTKYQSLASAAKEMIKTDIPSDMFKPIIDLTLEVKNGEVTSKNLDRDFFNTPAGAYLENADYDAVHRKIAKWLAPKAEQTTPATDDNETDGGAGTDTGSDGDGSNISSDATEDASPGDTGDPDDGTDDGTDGTQAEDPATSGC